MGITKLLHVAGEASEEGLGGLVSSKQDVSTDLAHSFPAG